MGLQNFSNDNGIVFKARSYFNDNLKFKLILIILNTQINMSEIELLRNMNFYLFL